MQASVFHSVRLITSQNVAMSVRLPARMEQLGSHWTDFGEI